MPTRPLTSVSALTRAGLVPDADADVLEQVASEFRIRITPATTVNGSPMIGNQLNNNTPHP